MTVAGWIGVGLLALLVLAALRIIVMPGRLAARDKDGRFQSAGGSTMAGANVHDSPDTGSGGGGGD
jgi:hypothetical protein